MTPPTLAAIRERIEASRLGSTFTQADHDRALLLAELDRVEAELRAERQAVVAWLRRNAGEHRSAAHRLMEVEKGDAADFQAIRAHECDSMADGIEAGEHLENVKPFGRIGPSGLGTPGAAKEDEGR